MHFLEEKSCTVRTIQYRIPTIKKKIWELIIAVQNVHDFLA